MDITCTATSDACAASEECTFYNCYDEGAMTECTSDVEATDCNGNSCSLTLQVSIANDGGGGTASFLWGKDCGYYEEY